MMQPTTILSTVIALSAQRGIHMKLNWVELDPHDSTTYPRFNVRGYLCLDTFGMIHFGVWGADWDKTVTHYYDLDQIEPTLTGSLAEHS